MGVCGTTYELCREEDVFEVSVFVPDNKSYLRAHWKSHFFALKNTTYDLYAYHLQAFSPVIHG